ncbi:hypothetical protein [Delftia acidovorans]|uniref:hypothetical protein n=1 Tax=Delftia acidovorans TaxID=80866 RepID=UPI001ED98473|nr:hypothetical protein [Delftia acidovorans]
MRDFSMVALVVVASLFTRKIMPLPQQSAPILMRDCAWVFFRRFGSAAVSPGFGLRIGMRGR